MKAPATELIVNPKDPSDPKPQHANVQDIELQGWTLWVDRHGPEHMAKVEAANAEKETETPSDEKEPVKEDSGFDVGEGAAVNPKQVRRTKKK